MLFFELQANCVVLGVGQFREAVGHSQDKQDGGVTSKRCAGIALFHLGQGGAGDRSAFGGDFGRNPPPPPCILYIVAELTRREVAAVLWSSFLCIFNVRIYIRYDG
jgi:hypothetical protein